VAHASPPEDPVGRQALEPLQPTQAADIMDHQIKKPASPLKTCPICGKPQSEAARPFSSSRCRDVDLNRWLKGSYVIPGRDDDVDDVE
jgi:endogenous inhibitor of DNA gyrase (YacG/DUF329 family)